MGLVTVGRGSQFLAKCCSAGGPNTLYQERGVEGVMVSKQAINIDRG